MRSFINTLTNQVALSLLNSVVVTVRDEVRAMSYAHLFLKRDARAMAMRYAAQKQRGGTSAVAGALTCLGLITPAPAVCPAWHPAERTSSHPSA